MPTISVKNIDELYDVLDNNAYEGYTVILTPNTYPLKNRTDKPTQGRLDFLRNMQIVGEVGDARKVVIDATALPQSSVEIPNEDAMGNPVFDAMNKPLSNKTGAIRMGNGYNSLEWVTVTNDFTNDPPNNPRLRSLIQTDVSDGDATVNVSNNIIGGASIGLNIINWYFRASGRSLSAIVKNNEIKGNLIGSFMDGIRIQHHNYIQNARIAILMEDNLIHGNGTGLSIFNEASDNEIYVFSKNDRFTDNGLGLTLIGGLNGVLSRRINVSNNSSFFYGVNMIVTRNNGEPHPRYMAVKGGMFAAAGAIIDIGDSEIMMESVSNNKLTIKLKNCNIAGNGRRSDFMSDALTPEKPQLNVFGAYNSNNFKVGWGNEATVEIYSDTIMSKYFARHEQPKIFTLLEFFLPWIFRQNRVNVSGQAVGQVPVVSANP